MGIITIAFDDGYEDTYKHCADFLAESGIRATFAIPSFSIGKTLEERPIINKDELVHLLELGHEVAAHTASHRNLLDVYQEEGDDAVLEEMVDSKVALEEMLDADIPSFVFPFIEKNQNAHLRTLAAEHYASSRITIEGHAFNKLPVKDAYSITGTAITKDVPMSEYERSVEILKNRDLWLIEVFHLVSDKNTKSAHRDQPYRFFTHIDDFKKHMRFILEAGIPIMTQGEVVRRHSA